MRRIPSIRSIPLILAISACGKENPSIVWLEGASYEWVHFNHRLSHVAFDVDEDGARAAIVGGTSTTGVDATLDPQCDPDECDELPFFDEALVRIDWGRVDDPDAVFEVVTAELTADEDGETTTVKATLAKADKREVTAVIRGLSISTDHPLDDGDSCYNPEFGWLPTAMGIELGEPTVAGERVSVDVSAHFTAGNTLEEFRKCIDDVVGRARVAVEVDVMIVAGDGPVETADVSGEATFEYGGGPVNPTPQELPAPVAVSFDLEEPMVGWTTLDWAFHQGDPDARGAYLRRLDWMASDSEAFGGATNYSPITQLSGFDYRFTGALVARELGGARSGGSVEATIPVELDGGVPVTQEIGATR